MARHLALPRAEANFEAEEKLDNRRSGDRIVLVTNMSLVDDQRARDSRNRRAASGGIALMTVDGGHLNRSMQHRLEIVLPATDSRVSCEGAR